MPDKTIRVKNCVVVGTMEYSLMFLQNNAISAFLSFIYILIL